MIEGKFNTDLMQLNQKQLEGCVSRSVVRSERRQILEKILANRDQYVSKNTAKGYRISKLFVFLVVTAMVSTGYLAYYLSSQ